VRDTSPSDALVQAAIDRTKADMAMNRRNIEEYGGTPH
jgi:hypothetical protein